MPSSLLDSQKTDGSPQGVVLLPTASPPRALGIWQKSGDNLVATLVGRYWHPWVEDVGSADHPLMPRPAPVTAEGWVH